MAEIIDREKELELSRRKFFEESKFVADNQKYGLFSFPGTLAVSKNPYYQSKKSRKNADGTVELLPHNIVSGSCKTGKSPGDYFSYPEYKSDKYTGKAPSYSTEKERADKMKKNHDTNWKPPGQSPEKLSLFEHKPSDTFKPIQRKQADGSVRLEPRNFYTSPPKKGSFTPGITFGKYPEHMPEPYQVKNSKSKADNIKGKIAAHDSAFKSTDFGNRYFSPDSEVYGGEFRQKTQKRAVSQSWVQHDLPFKPCRLKSEAFNPYPEYIPSPVPPMRRKIPSEREPWKTSVSARSTPTPSITKNYTNLRSEFPILRTCV